MSQIRGPCHGGDPQTWRSAAGSACVSRRSLARCRSAPTKQSLPVWLHLHGGDGPYLATLVADSRVSVIYRTAFTMELCDQRVVLVVVTLATANDAVPFCGAALCRRSVVHATEVTRKRGAAPQDQLAFLDGLSPGVALHPRSNRCPCGSTCMVAMMSMRARVCNPPRMSLLTQAKPG